MQSVIMQLPVHTSYVYGFNEVELTVRPTEYRNLQDHEQLECVFQPYGKDNRLFWSANIGWTGYGFAKLVKRWIKLLDDNQCVDDVFIYEQYDAKASVFDAVNAWFAQPFIKVKFTIDAHCSNQMHEIGVEGISDINRVVLPLSAFAGSRSDLFNVYYGQSSKGGGWWKTSLRNTLNEFVVFQALGYKRFTKLMKSVGAVKIRGEHVADKLIITMALKRPVFADIAKKTATELGDGVSLELLEGTKLVFAVNEPFE